MQYSEHSHRYSNDGGNQYSRRESHQSYFSSDNEEKDYNTAKGITAAASTGIYAQPYIHRTSYMSEKSDFTKTSKSTTGTTSQTHRKSLERHNASNTAATGTPTIALFGVGSKTSLYFLRHALDAGYHVRAMIIHQSVSFKGSSGGDDYHSTGSLYPHDVPVHALAKQIRNDFSAQEANGTLHWIRADYVYDTNAMRRTIRNTQFVVCMMQDSAPLSAYGITPADDSTAKPIKKRSHAHQPIMILPMDPTLCPDQTKPITSFLKLLYPVMKMEKSIKVFLYQASSVASDVKGKTPIFSKALKTLSTARSLLPAGRQNVLVNFTNNALHSDHQSVIKEIARHHRRHNNRSFNRQSLGDISNGSYSNHDNGCKESQTKNVAIHDDRGYISDIDMKSKTSACSMFAEFSYIITRPTCFLKEGRSIKAVSASKSQPGPFPIAHADLAEFTLTALRNKKLYNSCPYVVTDSF